MLIDRFGGQADLRATRAAPCLAGLRRRPGAHPARGALRGALRRGFTVGARDDGADARDGRRGRGGCAGARARVAGDSRAARWRPRPAHVRGAARVRRARAATARGRAAVGRAAARSASPRDRHRRASDAGAGQCARLEAPLSVRFACLVHDLGKGTTPPDHWPRHLGHEQRSARLAAAVAERLRVPTECRELADVVAREHGNIHRSGEFGAAALVRLLERCDAFRRPQRFADVLLACECDARGRTGWRTGPTRSASGWPRRCKRRWHRHVIRRCGGCGRRTGRRRHRPGGASGSRGGGAAVAATGD